MANYVIGDVHGCLEELKSLLEHINFTAEDTLYFLGDVVNVGPHSIEILQFIYNLHLKKQAYMILGNHELCLINAYYFPELCETPESLRIIASQLNLISDSKFIINWLENLPFAIHLETYNTLLVHAGVHPEWSLSETLRLAKETQIALQNPLIKEDLLKKIFENTPGSWNDQYKHTTKYLAICNYLTKVRFCDKNGKIDFETKGNHPKSKDYKPWFLQLKNWSHNTKILFGHWAGLEPKVSNPQFIAMDTGCVWGRYLSAYNLDSHKIYKVKSSQPLIKF